MKFSANILVGQYEEPFLSSALESIKWIDEFVFVINNATDSNRDKIYKFLEKYNKEGEVLDYYDYYDKLAFDKARNLAKEFSYGDYILKIDADEIYYDSLELSCKSIGSVLSEKIDVWHVQFFHLFYDVFHYRDIYNAEVLFKNDPDIWWTNSVHENLVTLSGRELSRDFLGELFVHFSSYATKTQKETLKKWLLYAELEGEPDRYGDIDGDHILDGVPVQEFVGPYPEAVQEYIKLWKP